MGIQTLKHNAFQVRVISLIFMMMISQTLPIVNMMTSILKRFVCRVIFEPS